MDGVVRVMTTLPAKLTFHIPHALAAKRQTADLPQSAGKARHTFNASIAEADMRDAHKTLALGVAVVSGEVSHARNMLDEMIRFMEEHADAELQSVEEGAPLCNASIWDLYAKAFSNLCA